jgi:hypothetical protein
MSEWGLGEWLTLFFAFFSSAGLVWQIARNEGMTPFESLTVIPRRTAPPKGDKSGNWFVTVEVEPGNPMPLYDASVSLLDETKFLTSARPEDCALSVPILMLEEKRHLRFTLVAPKATPIRFLVTWMVPSLIRKHPTLHVLRVRIPVDFLLTQDALPTIEVLHWRRFQRSRRFLNRHILSRIGGNYLLPLSWWKKDGSPNLDSVNAEVLRSESTKE